LHFLLPKPAPEHVVSLVATRDKRGVIFGAVANIILLISIFPYETGEPIGDRLSKDVLGRSGGWIGRTGTGTRRRIFREQVSSVAERQRLEAALDHLREGDQFTVTKLDR
jgi:hypothetical protein